MKSISAAIVIVAGIYGMVNTLPASLISQSGRMSSTPVILPMLGFFAALAVIALGLVGWWACLKYDR